MLRRPLVMLAIVLALGIIFIRMKEAAPRGLRWIMPPYLRTELEDSGEVFLSATVTGRVEWIECEDGKATLIVRETGNAFGRKKAGRVRVHLGSGEIDESVMIGACVTVSGDLFLYEEARNPGAFSVRAYYDSTGCYLAMTHASVRVERLPVLGLRHSLWQFGQRMADAVTAQMSEEEAGYLNSVLFRRDSGLTEEVKARFGTLNLVRMLKLTGVGLLLVGNAVYRFFCKRVKSRLTAALAAVLSVGLYAAVTGFTPTSVRALIVFAVRVLAPVVKRRFDLPNAAALMLILMLLSEPGSIGNLSVQFYIAVAAASGVIVPEASRLLKKYRPVTTPALYMLCTQCLLLPVLLRSNYAVSPVGMLLSPLFSVCVGLITATGLSGAMIGALAGKNGLSAFFFGTGHYLYLFQTKTAEIAEKLPCAELLRGCPSIFRVFLYYGLIAVVYGAIRYHTVREKHRPEKEEMNIGKRGELLLTGVFLLLLAGGILFLKASPAAENGAEIIMLDVGQGDCFLVRTRNGNYVIDCGSSSEENVGNAVLLPALRYYGITTVDGLFLSHPDEDHINGTQAVLEAEKVRVQAVFLPDSADRSAFSGFPEAEVRYAGTGDRLTTKSVEIRVLAPAHHSALTGNDASMVLYVAAPYLSVLFTGDITETQESGISVKADILKVAHHGSKYSTTADFLEKTSPGYALISCSANNPYGHPAPELTARLQNAGIAVYRTDEDGAVIVSGSKKGIKVYAFRESLP